MNDTDKYEGHTEGPVSFVINGVTRKVLPLANLELIADAPLLLAEVKRLRGVLEANLLVECDGCKNWLIEEQIMQHPHHTQWGWVCYSCSKLRESDEE